MKYWKRATVALSAIAVLVLAGAAGCGPSPEDEARDALQAKKATGETLEKKNLEEKRKREENPNAVGYVYKYTATGSFIGYWVIKGKVSSNGSQATPEQDIHWTCKSSYTCTPVVVDGPQDDGSYGTGDPGVFFFLADGTKIVLGDNYYVQSDKPIDLPNIPKLGGTP